MTGAGWIAALVGVLAIVMASLAVGRLDERGVERRRAEIEAAQAAVSAAEDELEQARAAMASDSAAAPAVAQAEAEVEAAQERLLLAEDRLERFQSASDSRFLAIAYWVVAIVLAAYVISLTSRLRKAREAHAARM